MSEVFRTSRRVEFRDTDMAGIVHFSNFFAYMEQTEHELLRSLGLGVIMEFDGEKISFPRVNAQCNYRKAIKFEQVIDIAVRVQRIGTKSITYAFDFSLESTPIADGSITVVCCKFDHSPSPVSMPIPAGFVELIQPFLESN